MNLRHPRWFVAAVALAIAASIVVVPSVSAAGSAPTTPSVPRAAGATTLTVGIQGPVSALPAFMAQHWGLLKKSGITSIKYSLFTSIPALLTAVQQGQLDIGFQTIAGFQAFDKASTGTKLKLLGAGQHGAFTWVARTGSGIPVATKTNWQDTVKAFKGRKIGFPALGGVIYLFTRYMATQAGLEPGKDYTEVPVGVGPPALAALQAGAVDVIMGEQSTTVAPVAARIGYHAIDFSKGQGPPDLFDPNVIVAGVYFTSEPTFQAKKKELLAFTAAYERAKVLMARPGNEAEVVKQAVKTLGVTPAVAKEINKRGSINKAVLSALTWDKTTSTYLRLGIITGPVPPFANVSAK